jgi:hypothetical protein
MKKIFLARSRIQPIRMLAAGYTFRFPELE